MSGEVRSRWQALIAQFERDRFFQKRYANCAKEPKALFDRIGEDLDSSIFQIRETALWALVFLTPELINLLHEKETRNPGWGDREGKDQKMVNEGLDGSKCIFRHLHNIFVKEHRFKAHDGGKKDPRPYLKTIIKNWEKDERRKRRNRDGNLREVPLDYEAALKIPDPAGSTEDYIIRTQTYWDLKREYCDGGIFRDEDKFDLFYTFNVDDRPLEEIRERWNIPSDNAVSQRKSRINKEIIAVRDGLFALLLISINEFSKRGKIPRFPQDIERSEEWVKRVKRSVKPSGWVGAVQDGKTKVAVRSLTTSLHGAPGHIYLAAIRNDCNYLEKGFFWHPKRDPNARDVICIGYNEILDWLINLNSIASREQLPTCYIARRFRRYASKTGKIIETELPGLNDALDGVSDEYETWLLSNTLPANSFLG